MTDKPDDGRLVAQAKQRSFRASLKRHPWIAAACVALGAVATLLLIGYFTIVFPVEQAAAKTQGALEKAFPNVEFVAGVAVTSKTLRHFISVEVSFIGDEGPSTGTRDPLFAKVLLLQKQFEMRDWLARWKVDHELTVPIVLRFRDPEYPSSHDWRGRPLEKRWLNQFVL